MLFDSINLNDIDAEERALVREFVLSTKEGIANWLTAADDDDERRTLQEMNQACDRMLHRLNFSGAANQAAHAAQARSQRLGQGGMNQLANQYTAQANKPTIAQQAAAAAQARNQRLGQGGQEQLAMQYDAQIAKRKLDQLLENAKNFAVLRDGFFGSENNAKYRQLLKERRDKINAHLGANAEKYKWDKKDKRIQEMLDYLDAMDKGNPYLQFDFRNIVRWMRKDINAAYTTAMSNANQNKVTVTPNDFTLPGTCTVTSMTTRPYGSFQIPYSMEITITSNSRSLKINLPGLTGGNGAPMYKHLVEYLDNLKKANIYDAINYCRSWLLDLSKISTEIFKLSGTISDNRYATPPKHGKPLQGSTFANNRTNVPTYAQPTSNPNRNTPGDARFLSPYPMAWEFIVRRLDNKSSADYELYHVLAKGLALTANPFSV